MILNDFECKSCGDISEYRYKYKNRDMLVCVKCESGDLSSRHRGVVERRHVSVH